MTTLTSATQQNIFAGETSWENLVSLAFGLTNQMPRGEDCEPEAAPREGLVYMAENSLGGREVMPPTAPVAHRVPGEHSGWRGYLEEDVTSFAWTSSTSGARLVALQGVAGWTLQYEGVTDPLSQRESVYLEFFFEAISGPVEVRQLDRPEVLGNFRNRPEVLEALAQAAECACGSGAHYTLCPMGSKECGWAPSRPLLMKSQKRAKYWPW